MTNEDADIEELREQHQKGSRIGAAATDESDEDRLLQAMADAFKGIENGDLSKTLSVRDEQLAGIVHGLEDEPDELRRIGADLQEALGQERNPEAIDRSEFLRLAIRAGLTEHTPTVFEKAKEAYTDQILDSF